MPKTLLDFFGAASKKPKLTHEASKVLTPSTPATKASPIIAKVKPSPKLKEKSRVLEDKENRGSSVKKREEKKEVKKEVEKEEKIEEEEEVQYCSVALVTVLWNEMHLISFKLSDVL